MPAALQPGLIKEHPLWLLCGALFGYLLLMRTNPVRLSLRDGWRAVRRYRVLWVTFGAFGCSHALFHLAIRVYSYCLLPAGDRPQFMWLRAAWRDPQYWLTGSPESLWYLPPNSLAEAALAARLPALESVAGIFNNLVSTFPLAAVAAVLLLINWGGHQMVLQRALRKRFGATGWLGYLAILICALAAVAKVGLYAAPALLVRQPEIAWLWFRWSPVVVWLAFLFEYLFGICIQIFLILAAYCWVRGLTFEVPRLLDFAIRRFSFVVKWAAVVLLLSSLFIDLPLILKNFAPFASWISADPEVIERRGRIARTALAIFLLIFAAMQITLTFHSERLRPALRDHGRFLGRYWWLFGWFLIVAGVHFYLWSAANFLVARGLGEGTAPGIVWSLAAPWGTGLLGAWMLASWVCLYRACDHTRSPQDNWIKF